MAAFHARTSARVTVVISREGLPRFWLAAHVHLCVAGSHVVLLDLERDCYLALDAAASESLGAFVTGWPTRHPLPSTLPQEVIAAAMEATYVMLDRRLLTDDCASGKSAAPHLPSPISSACVLSPLRGPPRIRTPHVFACFRALVQSALELKLLPLHKVVRRFVGRRARCTRFARERRLQGLEELVAVFAVLRPYFFGSRRACLLDSLALAHFLSQFGVASRWVFGVQDAPFAAHCWLVNGTTVLNDAIENVRSYTPLLEI
jgi:Transglutaminase-like superfamily